MRQSSELLLTFLLNATWLIVLIAAAAGLASWFLRESTAKLRHVVWVTALLLAFFIPLIAVSTQVVEELSIFNSSQPPQVALETGVNTVLTANIGLTDPPVNNSAFQLNRVVGLVLIIGYLSLIAFRLFRLLRAWRSAVQVRRTARVILDDDKVRLVMSACEEALGPTKRPVAVMTSSSIHVPVTFGNYRPVIILPEELIVEGNIDVLTSAIGHEYIHVVRCDYFFNLIYEFLYLPLSFHPAVAFIRRGIKQTRELCCDELVAKRIIKPEAYARSLVKLAGSAPTLRRLSITTTVGIADADILEKRIMSLLKKPRIDRRWKRYVLVVASLLLVVPCVAAAAFAMRFEMQPTVGSVVPDRALQEKERWRESDEDNIKRNIGDLRRRLELLAQEPVSPGRENEKKKEIEKIKINLEILEKRLVEGRQGGYTVVLDGEGHMEEEQKARLTLVRLARIQMDQAIQIATSLSPGTVLECTLNAERWEEPAKLAKDSRIFYHVEVLSGDEPDQVITHVLVNAIDGTVIRAEKELPRKSKRPE